MFLMFGLGYGFALKTASFGFHSVHLLDPIHRLSQTTEKLRISTKQFRIPKSVLRSAVPCRDRLLSFRKPAVAAVHAR